MAIECLQSLPTAPTHRIPLGRIVRKLLVLRGTWPPFKKGQANRLIDAVRHDIGRRESMVRIGQESRDLRFRSHF